MSTVPNEKKPAFAVSNANAAHSPGLTKFEYAAIEAMKGILASGVKHSPDQISAMAIVQAKSFFFKLNQEQS